MLTMHSTATNRRKVKNRKKAPKKRFFLIFTVKSLCIPNICCTFARKSCKHKQTRYEKAYFGGAEGADDDSCNADGTAARDSTGKR